MKKSITIQELLDTGAHFGHPTSKWNHVGEFPVLFL